MPIATGRKALVAASAAAISALGLLTAPAPAQAAPACDVYGFAGNVTIREDHADGFRDVSFSANGTTAGGPATTKDSKGSTSTGTISGGIIENGPGINLTYIETGGATSGHNYTGVIREDDLIATGKQGDVPWSTLAPLACLDAAEPVPEGKPVIPPGMGWVNGDVDMYDKPGGVGNKYPHWLEGGEGEEGQLVKLITCQPDNWCNVDAPGIGPVWVWGDFIDR